MGALVLVVAAGADEHEVVGLARQLGEEALRKDVVEMGPAPLAPYAPAS
jgi:hypothetical protein